MSTFGSGEAFVRRWKSCCNLLSAGERSGAAEAELPAEPGCRQRPIVAFGGGERSLDMSATLKIARDRSGSIAAGTSIALGVTVGVTSQGLRFYVECLKGVPYGGVRGPAISPFSPSPFW